MRDNLCLLEEMDKKLMKLQGGSCASSLTSVRKDLAVALGATRVRLTKHSIRYHSDIHRSNSNTLLQCKLLQTLILFILSHHKIIYHPLNQHFSCDCGTLTNLSGLSQ